MKVKGIKKILIGTLSIVLAITCFLGTNIVPNVAFAKTASSSTILKTDYKTTDPKPTYTDTLNKTYDCLNKLNKKENKTLKKAKEAGKKEVDKLGAMAATNIFAAIKGEDVDWQEVGVDVVKDIVVAVAGIWGFDGITSSILDGIESLVNAGDAPLSSIDIQTNIINQNYNRTMDELYQIEDELSSLSKQVSNSTDTIIDRTKELFDSYTARQTIISFMSKGEGNFSYSSLKNVLYGSTREENFSFLTAYYYLMLENLDDEVLSKIYCDALFTYISNNLPIFADYFFGEDVTGLDKSIVKFYYDYLKANEQIISNGETAESLAIDFALDIYTTYYHLYDVRSQCYQKIVTEMLCNALLNQDDENCIDKIINNDLTDDSKYYYDYNLVPITYKQIKDSTIAVQEQLKKADEQIASDLAYILGMENSYIVVDENGDIHDICNYGDSFGNVARGQVIYLNNCPDQLNEIFELDGNKYYFEVNGVEETRDSKYGIIDTKNYLNDFSVSLYYGSTQLYSIGFTIDSVSSFSGGSGTYDDPYLISNKYQFMKIYGEVQNGRWVYDADGKIITNNEMNACYKLIDDIDLSGIILYPIGTYKSPFNGILDGNGYTLSNARINSLKYDEKNITMTPTTGLFGTIGNKGVVENLIVENITIVSNSDNDAIIPEDDTSSYYIGGVAGYNNGSIYNCIIKGDSKITVDRKVDTADMYSNVNVYIGGIAGQNSNDISYCSIEKLDINAKANMYYHNGPESRNKLSLLVGGISAITNGLVSNCRVSDKTTISAFAKSTAYSSDNEKPYVTVKCGGIIAEENKIDLLKDVFSNVNIAYCRADVDNEGTWLVFFHRYTYDNVLIKAGQYYPVFFWLSDSDKLDDLETNKYSDLYDVELQKKIDEYNTTYKDFDDWDSSSNYSIKQNYKSQANINTKKILKDKYLEAESNAIKQLGNKCITDFENLTFNISKEIYNVEVKFEKDIKEGKCSLCGKENCVPLEDLIYDINSSSLNSTHMFFYVNGEKVKAQIIGYYGLDTYNDTNIPLSKTIKLLFAVAIDNEYVLFLIDMDITVREDVEIAEPVIVDIETDFAINSEEKNVFKNDNPFKIVYHYAHGDEVVIISDLNQIEISDFDTSNIGEFIYKITHNGHIIKQKANVFCSHQNITHSLQDDVSATCQCLGYEVWICEDCGKEIHKNYSYGEHEYCIEEGKEATCSQEGFTKGVYCSVCEKEFRASEVIQKLPHNYMTVDKAKEYAKGHTGIDYDFKDSEYNCANYHFCVNGNHYEPHQFTVSIGSDKKGNEVYIYTCKECGYSKEITDKNIIKQDETITTLTVSQGYALLNNKETTVYVYLDNNVGFYGASFGIRYDERLTLIKFEEGSLNTNNMKVEGSQEVYHGYNFIWANDAKISGDGTLLKLTFVIPNDAKSDDVYNISIVYGLDYSGNEGGFCTTKSYSPNNTKKFMTYSGSIRVVEHLPGDVDGNGAVDIMDAMQLAWSYIGKTYTDSNGQNQIYKIKNEYQQYADVNLSGGIDIQDIVWILQSVSGDFGTNLLYPEYFIKLNLNVPNDDGFDYSKFDDEYILRYSNNETILIDKAGNVVSFDYIKENMLSKGYTFDGLYLTLFGDIFEYKVESNDIVKYDTKIYSSKQVDDGGIIRLSFDDLQYVPFQRQQTLYARWSKNTVTFNLNGGEKDIDIQDKEYQIDLEEENDIILKAPTQSFQVEFIVDEARITDKNITDSYFPKTIYREFLYWEDQFENKYFAGENISLCSPNKGVVELRAVWGDFTLDLPKKDGRLGYDRINEWYTEQYNSDENKYDSNNLTKLIGNLQKKGEKVLTLYGKSIIINYKIIVDSDSIKNNFDYSGNDTRFTIENIQDLKIDQIDDSNVVGYKFNGWTINDIPLTNEYKVDTIKGVLNNIESDTIRLVANWVANSYQIIFCSNDGNDSKKTQDCTYDKSFTLYSNTFTRKGYKFSGWSTLPNGKVDYANEYSGKNLSSGVECKLYAVWEEETYNINMNANFGLIVTNETKITNIPLHESLTFKYTDIVELPVLSTSKGYYVFGGWEINGTIYGNFINKVDFGNDDCTLTANAVWTWNNDYIQVTDLKGLNAIRSNPDDKYVLIDNIDCKGNVWTPIETFNGTFDGDGHRIYNFSICGVLDNTGLCLVGFIGKMSESAYVYNLQIGFENFSTCIDIKSNDYFNSQFIGYKHDIYAGMLCGICYGKIENCSVVNCAIDALTASNNNKHSYGNIGGICGVLRGKITKCSASNVSVTCTSKTQYDGNMASARSGGIVGYAGKSIISECFVENCTIYAQADGKQGGSIFNWTGVPNARAGGIVGMMCAEDGIKPEISLCVSISNNVDAHITWTTWVNSGGSENWGYILGHTSDTVPSCLVGYNTTTTQCSGTNSSYANCKIISVNQYEALVDAFSEFKNSTFFVKRKDGSIGVIHD